MAKRDRKRTEGSVRGNEASDENGERKES